jgi:hypothetical protein
MNVLAAEKTRWTPRVTRLGVIVGAVLLIVVALLVALYVHDSNTISTLRHQRAGLRADKANLATGLATAQANVTQEKAALKTLSGQLVKTKKQVAQAKKEATSQFFSGYSTGSTDSYQSGYSDGYNVGYDDGWNDGFTP